MNIADVIIIYSVISVMLLMSLLLAYACMWLVDEAADWWREHD